MDDDDLYFPGHLAQISSMADSLLASHPSQVSAVGLYRQCLASVTPSGVTLRIVDFSRVIPGNKFFVIPLSCITQAAGYSPWAIPELIDEEAAERFARTGVNLVLARNNEATFVYMRRAQNLSLQSKDSYIDAVHSRQEFSQESELVAYLAASLVRAGAAPVFAPLPREFRLTCRRDPHGTVAVNTNFHRLFRPGDRIAFYLMHGSDRLAVKWYSADGSAIFPDAPQGCSVRAFVQRDGEIIARKAVRVSD